MEQLKEKVNIQNILIIFVVLQPIIDIITGVSIKYANVSITFGIIIRTIFMILCVILGIVKASKKYKIGMCVYYTVLLTYMLSFLFNSYIENGTNLIFLQIRGLVKNFYFPIILVALIPIFKECKINIDNKVLNVSLMLYTITIFVCSIIGIAFPTYKTGDRAGTVGLFYSANEIGAILCLLSPFLIASIAKGKLKIVEVIYLGLLIYAVLQIGTKVPYFGFIILVLAMVFICLINAKKNQNSKLYKKAGMFFSFLIAMYLITGLTPVGKNLTKIYGDVFPITSINFSVPSEQQPKEPPKLTEFKNIEEVKTVVVSGRNDFLKANKEKFIQGKIIDKILGIGFVENENGETKELKLTEMDYFDILFCNGILGTILFMIPILGFGGILIRYTILDRSKIGIEHIYSMTMTIVVALLAGHVLTSPAVSIYIAIILLKYYSELINIENKQEIEEEKNEKDNNISFASVNGRD